MYEGKLLHQVAYSSRSKKYEEVCLDGIKVDYFDAKNRVIYEVKKSNRIDIAHEWQLKYYLFVFEQNNIACKYGLLENPLLRKTKEVVLDNNDMSEITVMSEIIQQIIEQDKCPPTVKKIICNNCSYFAFCYANEVDE